MGPDIRNVNPIYQGGNNNPPDLFFVLHFHVDHTVRANGLDLFPGIFAVNTLVRFAYLSFTAFSPAISIFQPFIH